MRIVRTVGQAFEVCHNRKVSAQNTKVTALDHAEDGGSETPCDTSEQDRCSDPLSDDEEPRKGKPQKPHACSYIEPKHMLFYLSAMHGFQYFDQFSIAILPHFFPLRSVWVIDGLKITPNHPWVIIFAWKIWKWLVELLNNWMEIDSMLSAIKLRIVNN